MITFEEYKQLALNPPEQREESLFVVECITIDGLPERRRQHYPCYEISHRQKVYCQTLEKATDCVKRQVEEYEKKDKDERMEVFCYYIWEYPWGKELYEVERYVFSWRMYDAAGQLIDRNVCAGYDLTDGNSDLYSYYRGRSEELVRFKKGDIVEMVWRGQVMLGFVVGVPLSIERCWEMDKRRVESFREMEKERGWKKELSDEEICNMYACDISDDCYIVLTTSDYVSHSHVSSTDIFKPHFPIPNYMRKKLENNYQKYVRKNERENNI